MFLKKLEIGGFKSFAARSVLDFEGEGVAAIVGPNGSGKSNVADAIRWVLGEQSYKSIRSKKSEDVIFSGSNAKSRASLARVSMLLDNSSKKVPIDFAEVEITRSVYRDGSSEYLINGKKSRLLDVAELLARSGFGQSTYSVIGQGMVDSMLFYGPSERKVLFDEAAGVRQYELKREQTLKKLEDTAQNLIRIKDILSELNPRLGTLKRQAEKAKEKDAVKEQLLSKQKVYFASLWDRLNHQDQEKRRDLERISQEEAKITAEINELNAQFTEVLSHKDAKSESTKGLQQEIEKLEDQKEAIRQKIFTLRAKIEVSFSPNHLTKEEIDKKIELAKKELSALTLSNLQKEKITAEKELKEWEAKGFRDQIKELEAQKDQLKEELYTAQARLNLVTDPNALTKEEIDGKVHQLEAQLNELRVGDIEKKQTVPVAEIEKIEKEILRIEQKIDSKREEVRALTEELAGFDFGTVNGELSSILESQNLFLIQVEAAKEIGDLSQTIELGRDVSRSIETLLKKVGSAKEGKIAGMGDLQDKIQELAAEKEKLVAEKNDQKSEQMRLAYELSRAQSKRQELKAEIESLKKIAPVEKSNTKSVEKEITDSKKKIVEIDEKINSLQSDLGQVNVFRSKIMNVDFEIRKETEKKEKIESEIARLEKTKPVDLSEKALMEKEIEDHRSQVATLDTKIGAVRTEMNSRAGDYDSQGKILSEIKDKLTAKQSVLSQFSNEVSNIRVELARVETKKQDLKEEITREIGSEEVLANATIVPELIPEAARLEIEKLKNKLYAIGEIDAEVETEYLEVGERVTFLETQTGDLERAKGDLEKLISELDLKIKKQFEASFSSISQKFTHFFNILFGGGEAKLELVRQKEEDGEDRFGIEITAVPPGKRVRSLSALSGGERTLTSLALLFAILFVNPSPFCVLDEVDAALDETNTVKFLKIVKELSAKTQFIFISHNRETMKSASHIYGITMDDSHASRILSVRLEEALAVEKKDKAKKVAVS